VQRRGDFLTKTLKSVSRGVDLPCRQKLMVMGPPGTRLGLEQNSGYAIPLFSDGPA
jgi:hypothetical protein